MLIKSIIVLHCALFITAAPAKVDQSLRHVLKYESTVNILISFKEGTYSTLNSVTRKNFPSREDRLSSLTSALQANAAESQKRVLEYLRSHNSLVFESFWITNQVYVKDADSTIIETLATFDEIIEIAEEGIFEIDTPIDFQLVSRKISQVEWGISLIEAPLAWAYKGGNNGDGVVIATIDTGVRLTHEALTSNFVGEYGWFDPYLATPEPNDQVGHGTHTTGTAVGQGK